MYTIVFFVLAATGAYLLISSVVNMSKYAVMRSFSALKKGGDKKETFFDEIFEAAALKLSKFIYIDEWKKKRLSDCLIAVGIIDSPELYTANAVLKALIISALVAITSLFFQIMLVVSVIAFVIIYSKEIGAADKQLRQRRIKIESALPRFVSFVTEALKSTRDVIRILESYIPNAEEALKEELKVLVADMRSGNYELAILRFDARISSSNVSKLSRGLIGVVRGDDSVFYFRILERELREEEIRKLEKEALKRPPAIRRWSFVLLTVMVSVYMFVLIVQMISSVVIFKV